MVNRTWIGYLPSAQLHSALRRFSLPESNLCRERNGLNGLAELEFRHFRIFHLQSSMDGLDKLEGWAFG
jgi:hypothetical protein